MHVIRIFWQKITCLDKQVTIVLNEDSVFFTITHIVNLKNRTTLRVKDCPKHQLGFDY